MSVDPNRPDISLGEFLPVTENAAISSARWLGRGDNHAADQAAVDAMRQEFAKLPITGRVVIGEGEKDEAPEHYNGEILGAGGPEFDIGAPVAETLDTVARCYRGTVRFIDTVHLFGRTPVHEIRLGGVG